MLKRRLLELVTIAILLVATACSQGAEPPAKDRSLSAELPSATDLSGLSVVSAGNILIEEPDLADESPSTPDRDRTGGHRFYYMWSGSSLQVLEIFVYHLDGPEAASEFWREHPPSNAWRDAKQNLVDRDESEVERRIPQWEFEISAVENAVGLCVWGWDASGLSGCSEVSFWLAACSYVFDIDLRLPEDSDLDSSAFLDELSNLLSEEVARCV